MYFDTAGDINDRATVIDDQFYCMRLVLVSESSTGRSHDAVPLIVGNSLTSSVSTKLGTVQT